MGANSSPFFDPGFHSIPWQKCGTFLDSVAFVPLCLRKGFFSPSSFILACFFYLNRPTFRVGFTLTPSKKDRKMASEWVNVLATKDRVSVDVLSFRLVFPSASPRKLGPSSVGQESVSLLVYKSDQGECNSIPSTLAKLEGQANWENLSALTSLCWHARGSGWSNNRKPFVRRYERFSLDGG